MGMQVKDKGKSENLAVIAGIEIETLSHMKMGRLHLGLL